ncbi:MAG: type III-A CRISPR-associated protein Cas10/Csm1, partial [Fusobacterium sp.]|nr:type III-A CRISPR-associated protein Cas10/Csm1 [Fusobacterium sp.]
KECKICKKAESEQNLERNAKENAGNIELCNACNSYIKLGTDISKLYHKPDDMFILEKNCDKNLNKLIFPKFPVGYVEVEFKRKKELEIKLKKGEEIHRFYAINSIYYGEGLPKNIRVGNYNIKVEKEEDEYKLIEFKDLVKKSKGIERLAVLRADVDNLGSLFQTGFVNNKLEEPYKYITLSKSVVLSRYLSDFFKRKINLILEKKNAANSKNEIFKNYCSVINQSNEEGRNIVIVYSGGDDVFAIGTWNDIIEFSVDLRNAFKEFTNGKITLSAGIGFFTENFPVYQMAERTGDLEKKAKSYPTKDAVALFGEERSKELEHVYSWDEFIDKVLYEKYVYLKSKITFDESENSDKIFIGKSKWYKIMDLIKELLDDKKKDKRLDIARFAYILARVKSTEKNQENYLDFREKIFKWIKEKNGKDAKQLLTAINIIIYEEREK